MPFELEKFVNTEPKYRAYKMNHYWPPETRKLAMRAIKDYGFGGVVTNVPIDDGFTFNPDNLAEFDTIVKELEEEGLSYWIYDEHGYPSGIGDGKTLAGHPELEAKGLYTRRFVAYEPRRVDFRLDAESDKIVWAAKYPLDVHEVYNSILMTERMAPVPFTADSVVCELGKYEALFVFCVKPAFEGSHLTHNVCGFNRYINIMDPKAVRRYIDLCYEPVERASPGIFKKAVAVFTDEPSLMAAYVDNYEVWPYALAPWVDGLFEEFEAEYGFSLLPQLPFLFEGHPEESNAIRVQFQRLVGKLVARAFSIQLEDWCKAHGGSFSGHYLCEELIIGHVKFYGDFVEVLKGAGYPGIDSLSCIPEHIDCNTIKFVQIASRKTGANGMMVELNPWVAVEEFAKAPLDNATGTVNLLYLNGVRVVHSYMPSDYGDYDESLKDFVGYNSPADYESNINLAEAHRKYIGRADTIWFNDYIGRLGYMLEDTPNDANIFVYYGLEDAQAKSQPSNTSGFSTGREGEMDIDTRMLANAIYDAGHDFYYADKDDLVEAAESLTKYHKPMISGCEVKIVIVPAMDVLHGESLRALAALSDAGVEVLFHKKLPAYSVEIGSCTRQSGGAGAVDDVAAYTRRYAPCTSDAILGRLDAYEAGCEFSVRATGVDNADGATCSDNSDNSDNSGKVTLLKARYLRDGKEMYFVCNNSRSAVSARFGHAGRGSADAATIYNPADGSAMPILMGDAYTIPSFRGVFVMFD